MVRGHEQQLLAAGQAEFRATSYRLIQQVVLASSSPTDTNIQLVITPLTVMSLCTQLNTLQGCTTYSKARARKSVANKRFLPPDHGGK